MAQLSDYTIFLDDKRFNSSRSHSDLNQNILVRTYAANTQRIISKFNITIPSTALFVNLKRLNGDYSSDMFLARDVHTGKIVLLKVAPQKRYCYEYTQRFRRELFVCNSIDPFPLIVTFFGFYRLETAGYFVSMEYVDGGSLKDVITHFGPLSESYVGAIVSQIVAGLDYLHTEGVIHRNINPTNVVIDSGGVVKIIGFGCCCMKPDYLERCKWNGAPHWCAPEVVRFVFPYSEKVDIWALGIIIIELIEGNCPYHEQSLDEVIQSIARIGTPSMNHDLYSDGLLCFLDYTLKEFPEERVSAADLMKLRFFKQSCGTLVLVPLVKTLIKEKLKTQEFPEELYPAYGIPNLDRKAVSSEEAIASHKDTISNAVPPPHHDTSADPPSGTPVILKRRKKINTANLDI